MELDDEGELSIPAGSMQITRLKHEMLPSICSKQTAIYLRHMRHHSCHVLGHECLHFEDLEQSSLRNSDPVMWRAKDDPWRSSTGAQDSAPQRLRCLPGPDPRHLQSTLRESYPKYQTDKSGIDGMLSVAWGAFTGMGKQCILHRFPYRKLLQPLDSHGRSSHFIPRRPSLGVIRLTYALNSGTSLDDFTELPPVAVVP